MDKSKNKKMSLKKKILIVFGLAVILLIISPYASRPILDQLDHNRFIQLDKQVGIIYNKIKTVADKSDDWKYTKECSAEYTGWMQTGNYFCKAIISLDKSVKSAEEIATLQTKYFPIINNNLKESTTLSILPSNFGVDFVVGSVEKHYVETNTDIECWYLNQIYQKVENQKIDNDRYGSPIDGGVGNAKISLDCSKKARNYWYEPDEDLRKTIFDYKPL